MASQSTVSPSPLSQGATTRPETPATSFSESIAAAAGDPQPDPTSCTVPRALPERDTFNLERFTAAQDRNRAFERILTALRQGNRKPHPSGAWLWFVFPQLDHCGTGRRSRLEHGSQLWPAGRAMDGGLDEARALLRHPVLGARVRAAARAVVDSASADAFSLMDNRFYDVARLHSSLTVFCQAAVYPVCIHHKVKVKKQQREGADDENNNNNGVFRAALDKYFAPVWDEWDELLPEADDDDGSVPLVKKPGKRHADTLARLDYLEKKALEKRLASPGARCVCGLGKDVTDGMDRMSGRKIERKKRDKLVAQPKQRVSKGTKKTKLQTAQTEDNREAKSASSVQELIIIDSD